MYTATYGWLKYLAYVMAGTFSRRTMIFLSLSLSGVTVGFSY